MRRKLEDFPYKVSFASNIRVVSDASKEIAKASLSDLKTFFPKGFEERSDLFPWAANLTVANLGNENGDLIDTDVALAIFKKFENTQVNLEHNPDTICGFVTNAGLTKFNSNFKEGVGSELLDNSKIEGYEPFNIAVGGYVWAMMFPTVVDKLLRSSDPASPSYLKASTSWELGFESFKIQLGSRDRSEAEIIEDPARIKELFKYHKSQGGTGKTPDGKEVYRLISFSKKEDGTNDLDSIVPMGLAFTLNPAAAVAGVVTPITDEDEENETEEGEDEMICSECGETYEGEEMHEEEVTCAKCGKKTTLKSKSEASSLNKNEEKSKKDEKNISILTNSPVIPNTSKIMKKFTSLAEIVSLNDETKAEYSFANINHVVEAGIADKISTEIEKVAKDWKEKVEAEKQAAQAAKQEAEDLKQKVSAAEKELSEIKSELQILKDEQAKVLADNLYNERMASFDEQYDLDDEDRTTIAKNIKDADEEKYNAFAKDAAVFFKSKKKGAKKDKEQAKASTVIKDELDNVDPQGAKVPSTPTPSDNNKYANAFELGKGISFETRKK